MLHKWRRDNRAPSEPKGMNILKLHILPNLFSSMISSNCILLAEHWRIPEWSLYYTEDYFILILYSLINKKIVLPLAHFLITMRQIISC